jgi:hypothetical protein
MRGTLVGHSLTRCQFPPNLPLGRDGVRPQAVLDGGVAVADAQADEVVEIAVGQALDIQIDGRAFDPEFRATDDVDFLLPNRQRLERVVIFLAFVALPLGPTARAKCVGELRNGEDAFAAEFLALLRAHAGQQAEVVRFNRLLTAAVAEFTLGAVPVQDEVGRRRVGEQRGDFLKALPHFTGQRRGFHFQNLRL